MGRHIIVLYVGRMKRAHMACLEVSRMPKSPEFAIRTFCKVIRKLPPAARKLWNASKSRTFDIGIASFPLGANRAPKGVYWFAISAETLAETAKLRAQVAVTVYGKLKKAKPRRKTVPSGSLK